MKARTRSKAAQVYTLDRAVKSLALTIPLARDVIRACNDFDRRDDYNRFHDELADLGVELIAGHQGDNALVYRSRKTRRNGKPGRKVLLFYWMEAQRWTWAYQMKRSDDPDAGDRGYPIKTLEVAR